MALTKAVAAVDAWTAVAQNTIIEGATTDVSAAYQVTLHITVAPTTNTATVNGVKVIIQVSSATSGDINWEELTSFFMLVGITTAKISIINTLTAGQASGISAASVSGFTTEGYYLYIDDGASSEVVLEKSQSAAGMTIVDNVTYGHVSTTPLYYRAESISVNIPDTANRVRVLYDNTQDAAGSAVDVQCNLSKITSI
jgi:hypothetical protein